MAEITISLGQNRMGSVRLNRWQRLLPHEMRQGLIDGLMILEQQIVENLSGESHTKNPMSSNPFPGVLSGALRGSVAFKITGSGKDITGYVGPSMTRNIEYAAVHEFGFGAIPARPYLWPAWEKREDEVLEALSGKVFGAL